MSWKLSSKDIETITTSSSWNSPTAGLIIPLPKHRYSKLRHKLNLTGRCLYLFNSRAIRMQSCRSEQGWMDSLPHHSLPAHSLSSRVPNLKLQIDLHDLAVMTSWDSLKMLNVAEEMFSLNGECDYNSFSASIKYHLSRKPREWILWWFQRS